MQLLELFETDRSIHPEMQQREQYRSLVILKSFFALLSGDNSLDSVGELSEALLETPSFDLAAKHLKRDRACAELILDRYIPPAHNIEELLTYPADSLGYIYATDLREKGFDPNLHAEMTAETDARYVELRLSQTHDIWHIVTGFDTSVIGEIGLQAFHLPQFPYPLATVLLSNSLMSSTLLAPETLPELLEAIARGFQIEKNAQPFFAQKWEEGWKKPLKQWRSELNIQSIANQ